MTGLPWYKCDPRAFNDGMMGLSRAERGVYVTVLNCIYIEGGAVQDNPLYWAAMLGCSQAAWIKDRAALIAKGKLFEAPTNDGLPGIMNRRAATEIDEQLRFKSDQAQRGKKGGSAKRKKARSDKGISRGLASAKQPLSDRLAKAKPIEIEREIQTKTLSPSHRVSSDSQQIGSGADVIPFGRDGGR